MFNKELKKEILSHLGVSLVWLILLSCLHLSMDRPLGELSWLWLGGLAGTFLLDIDHLLYCLVVFPNEEMSVKIRSLVSRRRFWEAIGLLGETHYERNKLSFHNALFQPIFYVFCFLILTSSGSLFGKALVMAMALHLLKDEFEEVINKKEEHLRGWLFWQIKREVSLKEQRIFLWVMAVIFLGFNLLLL